MNPKPRKALFIRSPLLFGVVVLSAAFISTGCSRNNNQGSGASNATTPENSCLVRLRGIGSIFETEPLVVQVSEYPKAYIWQFSDAMKSKDKDSFGGEDAPVSTLEHIQAQAALYKRNQDQQSQSAPLMLTGDGHAKCYAVFEVIANARHAGIDVFYFDTYYRVSGRTGPLTSWEGQVEDPSIRITIPDNLVTITVTKEHNLLWNGKDITVEDYVERLINQSHGAKFGATHFVITVYPETPFNTLRYILDQLRRMDADCATIKLHTEKL